MRLNRRQLRRMIMNEAKAVAKAGPLANAYKLLMKAGNEFGKSQGDEFAEDIGSLLLSLPELDSGNEEHKKLLADIARKVEQAAQGS